MDKIYLNEIYVYYKELFTEKQQVYFEDYYMNDLSLSEIAENYNTSRNAIHKQIKDTENKLLYYEDKLGLCRKSLEIMEIIEDCMRAHKNIKNPTLEEILETEKWTYARIDSRR